MALPHGAVGYSAVCDCGVFWLYSLTFLLLDPEYFGIVYISLHANVLNKILFKATKSIDNIFYRNFACRQKNKIWNIRRVLSFMSLIRSPMWVGAKAKINLFSDYGHVEYQIQGNGAYWNMVGTFSPADRHTLTQGARTKGQNIFLKEVMLYIKLNGKKRIALWRQIFHTHHFPWGWVKGHTFFSWKWSCDISNQRERSVDQ